MKKLIAMSGALMLSVVAVSAAVTNDDPPRVGQTCTTVDGRHGRVVETTKGGKNIDNSKENSSWNAGGNGSVGAESKTISSKIAGALSLQGGYQKGSEDSNTKENSTTTRRFDCDTSKESQWTTGW